MSNEFGGGSEIVVTALFGEPFAAANAVRALAQAGFHDADIGLVGVLAGSAPNVRWFYKIGVPPEHASYYQSRFEDGGVLLLVRIGQRILKQIALAVLEQEGGILPPISKHPAAENIC
jgi:hypothetical protein